MMDYLIGRSAKKGRPTERYQQRQNKLVFSASLLVSLFWIGIVYIATEKSLGAGIVTAFAILYYKIHFASAVSSDAIFDSLWERINLQSNWMESRFDSIEVNIEKLMPTEVTKAQGSKIFRARGGPYIDESYFIYPEKE